MKQPEPVEVSSLVADLARALDEHGISYCHWKSNEAIRLSEQGVNDLDLLVARRDADRFRAIVSELGFSRAERTTPPCPPGKEDFFGYDAETGRLLHVDAHYQLVLGHDRTKNYRIPIEKPYLASADHEGGLLKVPSAEFEFVVLVLRMVLKYAVWDEVVWSALRRRRSGPKRSERRELAHLSDRIDEGRVVSIVDRHLRSVPTRLFDDCVEVARGRCTTPTRLRVGRRLEVALEDSAQVPAVLDSGRRLWRRGRLGVDTRTGRPPRYQLVSGGVIIALMGGDGSGKSTALDEIEHWIGGELRLRRIHLGKPPWSALTYVVRGSLKLAVGLQTKFTPAKALTRRDFLEPTFGMRAMLWHLCTARDRYLLYRSARRFANRGGIVISDRYPHASLDTMDVPQIARLSEDRQKGWIVNALARLEERYHRGISPPDLMVVLRVDPDIAVARKTDEPSDYVRRRSLEVWDVDWSAVGAEVIDASQPPDVVAAELRALIWKALG